MRNQFFDLGFLFDFYMYSVRGSTETPSARSNVSWCWLGKFRAKPTSAVFAFFPIFDRQLQINYKSFRKDFRQFGSRLGAHRNFYLTRYFTPRGGTANGQGGKFEHSFLPHQTTQRYHNLSFARRLRILTEHIHFQLPCSFSSWDITRSIV